MELNCHSDNDTLYKGKGEEPLQGCPVPFKVFIQLWYKHFLDLGNTNPHIGIGLSEVFLVLRQPEIFKMKPFHLYLFMTEGFIVNCWRELEPKK